MEFLEEFYKSNQTLVTSIGLIGAIVGIIGFFLVKNSKSIKIDKSINDNENTTINIKQ